MKNIKAIFFDIDGTLVSFKTHEVSQATKKALKRLKEKGIKIFIATGRSRQGLEVLKDIEFDGYITLNGQCCFTNETIIYENFLRKEDLETIVHVLKENPFPCGFTMPDKKIYNYKDDRVAQIHAITHNDDQPVGDISDITNQKVYQLMAFITQEEEQELLAQMPHCISARWHPLFTDITPIGGTKQLGIDKFLSYYHISLDETMAFGDGGNDKEMLSHVFYSVAMGNGQDDLKAMADYVCEDVDHEGISKALKHLGLIEEDA